MAAEPPRPAFWVIESEGHMPRCLGSTQGPSEGLLFDWHASDRYSKGIRYLNLGKLQNLAEHPILEGSAAMGSADCADWSRLVKADGILSWKDLDPAGSQLTPNAEGAVSLEGYRIDERTRAALRQISMGGSLFRDFDADEYLRRNPQLRFDRDLNRKLSSDYGVPFANEVYRKWEESKPVNARAKVQVLAYYRELRALSDDGKKRKLEGAFAGTTFFVAKELGAPPGNAGKIRSVILNMRALGLDTRIFDTVGTSSVESNRDRIIKQLKDFFVAQPHASVVLVGASKGVSELAEAILVWGSDVRIKGVLSLVHAFNHAVPGSLANFENLSSASQANRFREAPTRFPRNLPCFSLVGVIPGNGIAKAPWLSPIQEKIRRLVKAFGANDGFIEHPGTRIPDDWTGNSTVLVVNGSHAILDAEYEGDPLESEGSQRAFLGAIALTLGNQILARSEAPKRSIATDAVNNPTD